MPPDLCPICEMRHEPDCARMYAEGLVRLTPDEYFDIVDGTPPREPGA
jgi:hypothetical protein